MTSFRISNSIPWHVLEYQTVYHGIELDPNSATRIIPSPQNKLNPQCVKCSSNDSEVPHLMNDKAECMRSAVTNIYVIEVDSQPGLTRRPARLRQET